MDSVLQDLTEDKLEKLGLAMGEAIMFKMEVAKQERRISQAESLKNEGNTLMVSKNYDAAIAAYVSSRSTI